MRRTIESLAALNYDDKRKLIFTTCDSNISGSDNDRTTPRIVLNILGASTVCSSTPIPSQVSRFSSGDPKIIRTVREWNLRTGRVERVITDVHSSSVLSICAHRGYLASAGSDGRIGLWHIVDNRIVKLIHDHEDSVLCVRFDDARSVSCSKGVSPTSYYVSNPKAPIYW